MPAADPALWRQLRIEWESSPDLTLRDVARRLNVSAPTVTQRARKEMWAKQGQ